MVYGSDKIRAAAWRTLDGADCLLVNEGDLLRFNEAGLPKAGGSGDRRRAKSSVRHSITLSATRQAGVKTSKLVTLFREIA